MALFAMAYHGMKQYLGIFINSLLLLLLVLLLRLLLLLWALLTIALATLRKEHNTATQIAWSRKAIQGTQLQLVNRRTPVLTIAAVAMHRGCLQCLCSRT